MTATAPRDKQVYRLVTVNSGFWFILNTHVHQTLYFPIHANPPASFFSLSKFPFAFWNMVGFRYAQTFLLKKSSGFFIAGTPRTPMFDHPLFSIPMN